jgi:hypothetical protein
MREMVDNVRSAVLLLTSDIIEGRRRCAIALHPRGHLAVGDILSCVLN